MDTPKISSWARVTSLFSGVAGWFSTTKVLVAVGVLSSLAVAGATYRASLIEKGREEVRRDWQASVNSDLIRQADRIATLSNDLAEALNAYGITSKALAASRVEYRARGERMRVAVAGDEVEQRFGATECGVARSVGAGAFRAAVACRGRVEELGLGVGGLVESSESAHYEYKRAEALVLFSAPRMPTTPTGPFGDKK